jgi:hypothetical protein
MPPIGAEDRPAMSVGRQASIDSPGPFSRCRVVQKIRTGQGLRDRGQARRPDASWIKAQLEARHYRGREHSFGVLAREPDT